MTVKKNPVLLALCLNLVLAGTIGTFQGIAKEADLPQITMPSKEDPITFEAQSVQYDTNTALSKAEGDVVLSNGELTIRADYAEYNASTGDFAVRGNVVLTQNDTATIRWQGDSISGNIKEKNFEFGVFRAVFGEIRICSHGGQYDPEKGVVMPYGELTTCDCEKPHYVFTARKMRYLADGSIEAWHLLGKVGSIPFFYFPYVYIDHRLLDLGFEVKLGYSNKLGLEVGVGNRFRLSDTTTLRAMVDVYTKSGPGLELNLKRRSDLSETRVDLEARYDDLYDEDLDANGYYRGFEIDPERYRIALFHRQEFADVDGLSLRLKLDHYSDAMFLQDWSERGERYDTPQDETYAELAWDTDWFSFSLYARPHVNYFSSVSERLPEVFLDIPRINVGTSPFQYEGKFNAGIYRMFWRDYDDPNYFRFNNYGHERAEMQHFLYLPLNLFENKIQFTPRVGMLASIYSNGTANEISGEDLDNMFLFDDPDLQFITQNFAPRQYAEYEDNEVHSRVMFETGFELSTKFSKSNSEVVYESSFFSLDGLRHIVEPFVNYTLTSEPTLERERIMFFDEHDQLEQQHFIQVGVKQRWQTRQLGRLFTFASLDAYMNFHFEDSYEVENRQRHAAEFGLRATFRPNMQWGFATENLFDMENGDFLFNYTRLQYDSKAKWRTGITYTYISDHYRNRPAYSLGSNVLSYGTSTFGCPWRIIDEANMGTWFVSLPLGDKTRLTYTFGYDFHEHDVAGHSLVLNRNLHCWDFGAMFRVNNQDECGIYFVLTLKAFPSIGYRISEEE